MRSFLNLADVMVAYRKECGANGRNVTFFYAGDFGQQMRHDIHHLLLEIFWNSHLIDTTSEICDGTVLMQTFLD